MIIHSKEGIEHLDREIEEARARRAEWKKERERLKEMILKEENQEEPEPKRPRF